MCAPAYTPSHAPLHAHCCTAAPCNFPLFSFLALRPGARLASSWRAAGGRLTGADACHVRSAVAVPPDRTVRSARRAAYLPGARHPRPRQLARRHALGRLARPRPASYVVRTECSAAAAAAPSHTDLCPPGATVRRLPCPSVFHLACKTRANCCSVKTTTSNF